MKTKKNELIMAYAQSIGIDTAKELITRKIKAAALEDKEEYCEEEVARICGELMKEGGLIRIVAQTFIVYLERKIRRQIAKTYQLREDFLKQKETTHRIFTPVSLIGGYMEPLLEADNLNDGQGEAIRAVAKGTINKISDWKKMEGEIIKILQLNSKEES
ncbi:MAG: hypothetical protein OCU20_10185 [Methanophagales archaeon]|nr:hypothetical protein [Methanophagales archaeon]